MKEPLYFGPGVHKASERSERRTREVCACYSFLCNIWLESWVGQFVRFYGNMRRYDPLACRKEIGTPGLRNASAASRTYRWSSCHDPRAAALRILHPIFRRLWIGVRSEEISTIPCNFRNSPRTSISYSVFLIKLKLVNGKAM